VPEPLDSALAALRPLLLDPERLLRAVAAGRRRGAVPPWRRVELRPVDLGAGRRLQVVRLDATQAHTRNETYGAAAERVVDELLAQPWGNWHVDTVDGTVQLRTTKRGEAQVHRTARPATNAPAPRLDRSHDRTKRRVLDPAEPFLRELGVTDEQGRVKPSRQDKYHQVEALLRQLDAVLDEARVVLRPERPLRVVDLGCGNAYLTLGAYRFLTGVRGLDVELVGVDLKSQARAHNTAVVARLGWADHVRFVEGGIATADAGEDRPDVVLALHACDTATDDSLARAVRWQAPLVLASPCCHHDVQRQLAGARRPPAPYGLLTRHGILRERFADVLTDALRAALLRLLGYRVEVVEFVGSQHTPRNTLLRAVRTGAAPTAEQVEEYRALTGAWGVVPRLQVLLAQELADVLG
jgi:SAM-dependent methyltransferase